MPTGINEQTNKKPNQKLVPKNDNLANIKFRQKQYFKSGSHGFPPFPLCGKSLSGNREKKVRPQTR